MTPTHSPSNADVHKTLLHHDQKIVRLEGQVTAVQISVDKLADAFYAVRDQLVAANAQVRPGIRETLGVVALGGGIVSMMAAAVTFLVVSYVAPQITEIRGDASAREVRLQLLEADRNQEYTELRTWFRRQALQGRPLTGP